VLQFQVKDQIFTSSLEAQEYAESYCYDLSKIKVLGGKAKHPKFLTLTSYKGDQLDLFQKSQIKAMVSQQLEIESEDWVQVTLQTGHCKIDYSIAPCFIPLFVKKLGVKLDVE